MRTLFAYAIVLSLILVMFPLGVEGGSEPIPDLDQKTRSPSDRFFRIAMQDDMKTLNTVIASDDWDWNVLEWTQSKPWVDGKNIPIQPWILDDSKGDLTSNDQTRTGYHFDPADPKVGKAWIRPGIHWVQGIDGQLSRIPLGCDPALAWDDDTSQGTPCEQVTAADLVFTYEFLKCAPRYQHAIDPLRIDIKDPGDPCDDELGVKVMADDPFGLEFTFARTTPYFLDDLLGFVPYHQATWSAHEDDKLTWQPDPTDIPGTGPFLFAADSDWRRDQLVRLTRNPFFFAQEAGLTEGPHIDGIEFQIYKNTETAVLALQNGDVDCIAWTIPPGYIPTLLDTPEVVVEQSPELGFFYATFNFRNPAFGYDSRGDANRTDVGKPLRQAIAHSIDKISIVNRLLQNYGTVGTSVVSPANAEWYNSSVRRYPFDPQKAIAILEANGYQKGSDGWYRAPDGGPIDGPGGNGEITIRTPPADYDPIRAQAGFWIAENLKEIGIKAVAKVCCDMLTYPHWRTNFEVILESWTIGGQEPDYLYDLFRTDPLDILGGYNANGYSNPDFDVLVDEMVQSLDRDRRIELNKQAQGIIAEDLVYDVLYYRDNIEAFRTDRFEGYFVKELGGLFNLWTLLELQPKTPRTDYSVDFLPLGDLLSGDDAKVTIRIIDQFGQPVSGDLVQPNALSITGSGASVTALTAEDDLIGVYSATVTAPVVDVLTFLRICGSAHEGAVQIDSLPTCISVRVLPLSTIPMVVGILEVQVTLLEVNPETGLLAADLYLTDGDQFPLAYADIDWTWRMSCRQCLDDLLIEEVSLPDQTDINGWASVVLRLSGNFSGAADFDLIANIATTIEGYPVTGSTSATVRLLGDASHMEIGALDGEFAQLRWTQDQVSEGWVRLEVWDLVNMIPVVGARVGVSETFGVLADSALDDRQAITDTDGQVFLGWTSHDVGEFEVTWAVSKEGYSGDSITIHYQVTGPGDTDSRWLWFIIPGAVIGLMLLAVAIIAIYYATREEF